MQLKNIIIAEKTDIDFGPWRNGKVPKADFPVGRKPYNLGSSYSWCVLKFRALEIDCKVLVIMNEGKQKYEAVLGVMTAEGSLKILCSYEYHPSEPGWHCHATHDEVSKVPAGWMRGPWIKRRPAAHRPHRLAKFAAFRIGDTAEAVRFAQRRYRIEAKGSLL